MVKLLIALYMILTQPLEAHQEEVSKAANIVYTQAYEVVEEPVEESRPKIPDIPLDDDLLDYIWDKSEVFNISYTLVLSVISVESNFDEDAVSNKNSVGLMQLNPGTAKWIANELNVENYDLTDPKTNIMFGIYYLDYLRNQWLEKGYSEEDTYSLVLISYNRGEAGARAWVKEHGFNNKYLSKVDSKKEEYERVINEQNYD